MKLTTEQQTIAILDLVIEMAAKNMAFQELIVTSFLCENDLEVAKEVLNQIKLRADDNIELLRAKVFQYAKIDPDDLLNGRFDI